MDNSYHFSIELYSLNTLLWLQALFSVEDLTNYPSNMCYKSHAIRLPYLVPEIYEN